MIENILFIAICLLVFTEIIFAFGFVSMMVKIKELKADYEFFKSVISTMRSTAENDSQAHKLMYEQYKNIYEQYKTISEKDDLIVKSHMEISNNYKKLLECWKDIDEQFESSYEQFNLCADELRDLKKLLEPPINVDFKINDPFAESVVIQT